MQKTIITYLLLLSCFVCNSYSVESDNMIDNIINVYSDINDKIYEMIQNKTSASYYWKGTCVYTVTNECSKCVSKSLDECIDCLSDLQQGCDKCVNKCIDKCRDCVENEDADKCVNECDCINKCANECLLTKCDNECDCEEKCNEECDKTLMNNSCRKICFPSNNLDGKLLIWLER